MQQLFAFPRFDNRLQSLIVIRYICLMLVHSGFQFYNSNNFFLLIVDHSERFGDISHLHRINHLTDFLWQFGHLEFRSAVVVTFKVLVHHQTFVISCILVSRDKQDQQQQNQDQQQQQDDKKQDKTQEQQPQQQEQMSKDNAQQMLDAFLQDEKDTQEKVKKAQAQQQQRRRTDKEW